MNEKDIRTAVMERIERERVRMRPRWHFLLFSAFGIVGSLLVFVTAVYTISFVVFLAHRSGAWYAPSFGARGWFSLLRSLPWLLVTLVGLFALLLEILVRKYRFVYRKPLVASLFGIVLLALLGGLALGQTPLHPTLARFARHGELPPAMGIFYREPPPPPADLDVYRGRIASSSGRTFIIVNEDGGGTTTVLMTPHTRLPYGADFTAGDLLVVVGDTVATGTVKAFGIREIDE